MNNIVEARTPNEKNFIKGEKHQWELVVGLEVHAQVLSQAKLFSGASTAFGCEQNANVSLVDAAMPGMLPTLNEKCVAQAVRTGLGLKAKINSYSVFERKNYFYPDLPQGYQISQFQYPIVGEGEVLLYVGGDKQQEVKIGIERLHLEQDAGKSMHDQSPNESFVDLNRSGVALMEIVSKPDIRSADEAKAYVSKLRSIVRYLGTCDGNMEQGSMRADVNVSVRQVGGAFGTRCEIKNVNSLKFIGQAIEYEARRQIEILENGGEVVQETRLFDSQKGQTRSMRTKEQAHDYRYFPDPDLLPLEISDEFIQQQKKTLPELPDDKRKRFCQMGLSNYDSSILVSDKNIADYFESVAKGRDVKLSANWVINDLLGSLNKENLEIENSPINAQQLGEIIDMIAAQTISGKIGKEVFAIVWQEGGSPKEIVATRKMAQVTDTGELEKIVNDILAQNSQKVEQVKQKPNMLGWFVGQVMQASGGKANPQAVNKILREKIGVK